jgi:hypothetical protein
MHIDRTDREAGTQRERETADSWLAKQTTDSRHLLIFTSSPT